MIEASKIEAPNLAAMVASKLCHDVLGLVSGANLNLGLLRESEAAQKEADIVAQVDDSVQKMWARFDFYRFAIGGAVTEGVGSLDDAREIMVRVFDQLKPDLTWSASALPMPHAAVRAIANLIFIAGDCLPRGGGVEISASPGEVRIVAQGRVMVKPAIAAGLRGEAPEGGFKGDNIYPALARLFAERAGVSIEFREEPEKLELLARSREIGAASAAA